jgi:hypothetical protein
MKTSHISFIASITALLLSITAPAVAQTGGVAPTNPIAPGADIPTTGLGAIGPGGVPIAPGSAAIGDTFIGRIAPGGTRLAPGPAGSVGGTPLLSTPAVPGARVR